MTAGLREGTTSRPISYARCAGAVVALARRESPTGRSSALRRQDERRDGRWVARSALAVALGPGEPVRIGVSSSGAPVLAREVVGSDGRSLALSITHTARYVAAVVAPEPCGIDICDRAEADRVVRTAPRMFGPAELDLGIRDDPWLALTAWAVKEAALKMAQTSIFAADPKQVRILCLEPPRLASGHRVAVSRLHDGVLAVVLQATPPTRRSPR